MPSPQSAAVLTETLIALGQTSLDRGDRGRAVEWFRSAARGGDARALNMLGRCHEHGWGVVANPRLAADYYLKASDRGDVWALFNLADLYGRGVGVARDDEAAYRLYAAAAGRGHAKALNMLGLFHEAGRVVPADLAGAMDFFKAAGEGGDCWGCFNLARLLVEAGRVDLALPWFQRGLDTGFPDFHRAMADALDGHADERVRALALAARQAAG